MTPDPQPPVFPRVSGPSDDNSRSTESSAGSIFSKPTPTQPVAHTDGPGAPTAATGSSRSRWLIALLATIAVVAVIGGVFLSLGPRAGSPSVAARYVPADTTMFVEAQLDLPGDQQDNLAEFMSHFPGFADPAAFDQKMDEMLEQAFTGVGGELNWATDVEPWFGGLVAGFGSKEPGEQESRGSTSRSRCPSRTELRSTRFWVKSSRTHRPRTTRATSCGHPPRATDQRHSRRPTRCC